VGEPVCAEDTPREALVRRLTEAVQRPSYRFPTLPGTAADVMRLANTREVTFRDVDRVIRRDPIIAARVLAIANSSAFTSHDRVLSLRTAMMILGWNAVRDVLWQVVAEAHVFRSGGSRRYLQQLRLHGVATAHVTRMLCRELSVDGEHAFVCGLLHDLGRPLALELLGNGTDATIDDIEATLDTVHADFGGRVAKAWNLPDALVEVTQHHHDYDTPLAPCADVPPMSLVVAAAERIVEHHGLGTRAAAPNARDPHTATLFARLGLSPADVEELIVRTEDIRSKIL
jgi:putative nucleotidyltransferase with HDIG domain